MWLPPSFLVAPSLRVYLIHNASPPVNSYAHPIHTFVAEIVPMPMPDGIQLSRAKGWRMPPDAAKVDRSSRW